MREHLIRDPDLVESGQELFPAEVICQLRSEGLIVLKWVKRKSDERVSILARSVVCAEAPAGGIVVCSERPVWLISKWGVLGLG